LARAPRRGGRRRARRRAARRARSVVSPPAVTRRHRGRQAQTHGHAAARRLATVATTSAPRRRASATPSSPDASASTRAPMRLAKLHGQVADAAAGADDPAASRQASDPACRPSPGERSSASLTMTPACFGRELPGRCETLSPSRRRTRHRTRLRVREDGGVHAVAFLEPLTRHRPHDRARARRAEDVGGNFSPVRTAWRTRLRARRGPTRATPADLDANQDLSADLGHGECLHAIVSMPPKDRWRRPASCSVLSASCRYSLNSSWLRRSAGVHSAIHSGIRPSDVRGLRTGDERCQARLGTCPERSSGRLPSGHGPSARGGFRSVSLACARYAPIRPPARSQRAPHGRGQPAFAPVVWPDGCPLTELEAESAVPRAVERHRPEPARADGRGPEGSRSARPLWTRAEVAALAAFVAVRSPRTSLGRIPLWMANERLADRRAMNLFKEYGMRQTIPNTMRAAAIDRFGALRTIAMQTLPCPRSGRKRS